MPIVNHESNTRIDSIADGIYRISTPVPPNVFPGGFTFNQFLIVDKEPLLFHTGPRKMFPLVCDAVAHITPVRNLRWIAFSHFEADECGSLNDFLAVAPSAEPLCSMTAKMVSIDDYAERPARGLTDGETLKLGSHSVRWIDTPHLPHGWETGYLFEESTKTLFCGDLFTQSGHEHEPVTTSDILANSEAMRQGMDYFAHGKNQRQLLAKLAETNPTLLACMHGASWSGRGGDLLKKLADTLS